MQTIENAKFDKGKTKTKSARVSGKNEKAMFVNALKNVNWTDLYYLKTCKEQFYFFDQVMTNLMDTYFPTKTVVSHTKDNPWVTKNYKDLI